MLANACMQFLGKSESEIRMIALETLEGHQRAIMGNMTVEEIYQVGGDGYKYFFKNFSSKYFIIFSSNELPTLRG